jgi:hypothetical protein
MPTGPLAWRRRRPSFGMVVALTPLVPLALFAEGCKRNDAATEAGAPDASAPATAVAEGAAPTTDATKPMNATPLPFDTVASAVNPRNLPAYAGPTGSIEGVVYVKGGAPPDVEGKKFDKCPGAAKTKGKLFQAGEPIADGRRPLAGAVIAVTGYAGYFVPEKREAVRIEIRDCAEAPRTVVMTFGQRLEIANRGTPLFAPQLAEAPDPALMVAPPQAEPVKLYPPRPGHFRLVDRLEGGFFDASLYVLMHPLHAVSGPDGKFRIDGVPLGALKVGARLAAIHREDVQPVDIRAGQIASVELTLLYEPPAPASADAPDLGPIPDAGVRKPPPKLH